MAKRFRLFTAWLCVLVLTACLILPVCADDYDEDGEPIYYPETNALEGWPEAEATYGQTCLLMDAETGAILCSRAGETMRYPASTTKIMTALLTVENCSLTEIVTMTDEGTYEVTRGDSSNAETSNGEEFTVEQCLYMLMLKSANDIANQLAVHVGGSIDNFAEMMNARAVELGCTGTHFHNASGMPDEEHYTTAHDLARIMREVIKNDTLRTIMGTVSHTIEETNMSGSRYYENHNKMIDPDSDYYYEYCFAGKTGFTEAAQRTLITASEKDGHTLICVTMKTPDKSDYYDQRHLYNYGFDQFRWVAVPGGTVVLPADLDASPFMNMFPDYLAPDAPAKAPAQTTGESGEVTMEVSAPDPVAAEGTSETGTGVVGEDGTSSLAEEVVQTSVPVTRTVESGTPGYSAVETDNGDGTVSIRYFYQGMEVGRAEMEKPAPVVESVPEVVSSAVSEKAGKGTSRNLILPIAILLGAAVAALVVLLLFRWRKAVEEQRNEERAIRREQRRIEREYAWAGVESDDDDEDWDEPEDEPLQAAGNGSEDDLLSDTVNGSEDALLSDTVNGSENDPVDAFSQIQVVQTEWSDEPEDDPGMETGYSFDAPWDEDAASDI